MYIKRKSKISMNCGSRRTVVPSEIANLCDIDSSVELEWVLDISDVDLDKVQINIIKEGSDENNKNE